jgi:hypothetical protein
MSIYVSGTKKLLREPTLFTRYASRTRLRRYQAGVCEAIVNSVLHQRGLSFVVMFPRQSGKNELQAQLETYLLALFSDTGCEIVKVSPTLKPQAQNAMRRLESTLKKNIYLSAVWHKEAGTLYQVKQARIQFLSGAPESSIVGATASLLLEVDEAQDVLPAKFDKDIAPMTASTHATRVFWGTAWTSHSLLGRELRAASAAETRDGQKRVFRLTAEAVAAEVAAYGASVQEAIERLGRNHPLVRTQYFSEEIDDLGGLFPPERIARMQCSTLTLVTQKSSRPQANSRYAILLDVAGADEEVHSATSTTDNPLAHPQRDATALTLVEVLPGSSTALPVYHPRLRKQWIGVDSAILRPQIVALAREWKVRALVIDATGVGAGLSAELAQELPGLVTPFLFNAASKSTLGWNYLGLVDGGRWQEEPYPEEDTSEQACWQREFWRQLAACQFEVLPGPDHHMKWSVPNGRRDPESGKVLHDDWVLSAALVSVLDRHEWAFSSGPALIVRGRDPLQEMEGKF